MAAWLAVVPATLWPALAHACAACTGGDGPRAQAAFFRATVFMTLLPLGLIGGGLLWLRRGGREWLAREFEDRDAYTPPTAEPGRIVPPIAPPDPGDPAAGSTRP
ncbi:MAG: hypothetical protein ACHQ52_01185 [Candidatus Eisenbacteria bacterium]